MPIPVENRTLTRIYAANGIWISSAVLAQQCAKLLGQRSFRSTKFTVQRDRQTCTPDWLLDLTAKVVSNEGYMVEKGFVRPQERVSLLTNKTHAGNQ